MARLIKTSILVATSDHVCPKLDRTDLVQRHAKNLNEILNLTSPPVNNALNKEFLWDTIAARKSINLSIHANNSNPAPAVRQISGTASDFPAHVKLPVLDGPIIDKTIKKNFIKNVHTKHIPSTNDINSGILPIVTNSPTNKHSHNVNLNSETNRKNSDPVLSAPSANLPSTEWLTNEIRNLPSLLVSVPTNTRPVLPATFNQNSVKTEIYTKLNDAAPFTDATLVIANLDNNKIHSNTVLYSPVRNISANNSQAIFQRTPTSCLPAPSLLYAITRRRRKINSLPR
mmetsp:Transcript_10577/g.21126  ORF Transcript_10577/g.21126 Transcript_10577/m.21126 type:complete len:286 (-) Transcript_10577:1522-2379(-)